MAYNITLILGPELAERVYGLLVLEKEQSDAQ